MIQKEIVAKNGTPVCRVTFTLPSSTWATAVHLAGDFNNWSRTAHPFRWQPDGSWALTLDFECGRSYQFRYVIDGRDWINDGQADAFVRNDRGSDNCVLLTGSAPTPD